MSEARLEVIGQVSGFFAKAQAAVVVLSGSLRVGDLICIKGHTTELQQRVDSLQLQHQPIQEAGPGQTVGLKVSGRCRRHDVVYKVVAPQG